MAGVQRTRAQAEAHGKLSSTPQQTVSTQTQDGQSSIAIEPANPQVIYVPAYDPQYIWGPRAWGTILRSTIRHSDSDSGRALTSASASADGAAGDGVPIGSAAERSSTTGSPATMVLAAALEAAAIGCTIPITGWVSLILTANLPEGSERLPRRRERTSDRPAWGIPSASRTAAIGVRAGKRERAGGAIQCRAGAAGAGDSGFRSFGGRTPSGGGGGFRSFRGGGHSFGGGHGGGGREIGFRSIDPLR
jgi:hypothetical protein